MQFSLNFICYAEKIQNDDSFILVKCFFLFPPLILSLLRPVIEVKSLFRRRKFINSEFMDMLIFPMNNKADICFIISHGYEFYASNFSLLKNIQVVDRSSAV